LSVAFIISLVGILCMVLGVSMLAPMAVGFIYGEAAAQDFLIGALFSLGLGALLFWLFREKEPRELNHRDGLAIVGLAWVAAGVLGGVPLFLTGEFSSFTDCVFESISGFTTTGASILTNIEACSKTTLFWRALTHWLGGMGFVVLSIAILPFVGVGGMQLYKAEVPSPTPDKLHPRITDTASILWKVYAGLTAAQIVLLMLGGMDWFEATCHAFATLATGGFSTRNASLAAYPSPYIQWVVTIFMVLAGINFTLHFYAVRKKLSAVWRDEEWRFYTGGLIMLVSLAASP
jgi:trk system potassium uptake protein TrkH